MKKNKRIAIVGGRRAYLPERYAYKEYFEDKGFSVDLYENPSSKELISYDILWIMMGVDRFPKIQNQLRIHEYQSIPVDKINAVRKIKSIVKKRISKKPNLRVFKNTAVKEYFAFNDGVEHCYRDMGVHQSFFIEEYNDEKTYDFVYLGDMSKERRIDRLCKYFSTIGKEYSLLLIGLIPDYLNKYITLNKNIHSIGKIDYYDVPEFLKKCRIGIHYIPNSFPFNVQLSTKLLEYCATSLNIVTTSLPYIEEFEKQYDGRFYHFEDDFSNFNFNEILNFKYKIPDLRSLEWNTLLDKSNLYEKVSNSIN